MWVTSPRLTVSFHVRSDVMWATSPNSNSLHPTLRVHILVKSGMFAAHLTTRDAHLRVLVDHGGLFEYRVRFSSSSLRPGADQFRKMREAPIVSEWPFRGTCHGEIGD